MDKEQLIELIKPYKEKLSTTREWDIFAREQSLPTSNTIIYHFDSWNNAKKILLLDIQKRGYTLEELKAIAEEHKDYFKTKAMWSEYSKENNLPCPNTFIAAFESWSEVKSFLNLNSSKRKKDVYTKEDIKEILKDNGKNFINRKQWDEFAKENKFPTYKTIKKHFTYDEFLMLINKKKWFNFTRNELIDIAKKYKYEFFTMKMKEWDDYAKEKKLPSSYIFSKEFGSWRKAKGEISIHFREP